MLKLSQSTLSHAELKIINEVIQEGYLGMGAFVKKFEEELRIYLKTDREIVTTNTGTSALHLAIQACGIGPGDEVILPSITYVGCFQAISATGAKPIACDIRLNDGMIDIPDMQKRINTRTKAIMAVHYAGSTNGIKEIRQIAKKYGLRLIEDAAHSFGGDFEDNKIGATGDIVCFSFDSIKNITCGEGGAVVTDDKNVANKIRDLRLLGVEKDSENRFQKKRSWDFDVTEQGWRYHMSNINAAIGLAQLSKADHFKQKRQHLVQLYINLLKETGIIPLLKIDKDANPHIFPIRVLGEQCNRLKDYLSSHGIETGKHYKPNHTLTAFKQGALSNAELFWEQELTLPLHCNLKEADIDYICCSINNFFQEVKK
ncbi:DegT/DnrJ/EryC1/StrS family aminotransferase [Candidatus Odyssella thessalonicensis]|uniref:DegT/DnrJ/EryC1/StrS family aminotransferase n=1 Tax=Candidatus Odyssella thessalonicensis TaxID=84647 RepID=UPI000495C79C|nr:DegT/DnrJ/EryC1/StrS family aminotransferase [Candidatus Odyssella thessalonicensis]